MARKTPFRTAMDAIQRITDLDQLRDLKTAIEDRMADLEQPEEEWQPPEGAIETRRAAEGHYALEWVRCGKERCRCAQADGKKHGPYWYLYRYAGGRKYSKQRSDIGLEYRGFSGAL